MIISQKRIKLMQTKQIMHDLRENKWIYEIK